MARINLSDREITIIRGLFNKELKHNDYMYKSLIAMTKDNRIETTEKDNEIIKKYGDIIDDLMKIAYKFEWDFEKNKYGGEE